MFRGDRLFLVSPDASPQTPPPPDFGPLYLSQILLAYSQHYGQRMGHRSPVKSWVQMPLTPEDSLPDLWQRLDQCEAGVILYAQDSLATPLSPETIVADLAWDWRLDTILVVSLNGQTVPQTLAYTALARQHRCPLKGLVFCAPSEAAWNDRLELAPPKLLTGLTHLPILGTLPPWNAAATPQEQADLGSNLALVDCGLM